MSRIIGSLILLALACHAWAIAPPDAEALARPLDEGRLADIDADARPQDREALERLYSGEHDRLLWSDGAKPTAQALALLHELRLADERGLDPDDYPGNRLAQQLVDMVDSPNPEAAAWAAFDVGLSYAALRYLSDLHFGRIDPASVGHDLSIDRGEFDLPTAVAQLARAANLEAAVDAVEPQFEHYALLKKQLAIYRALAAEVGLNDLPPLPTRSVKPGEAYAGAAQLAHLLAALGDLPAPGGPPSDGPPQEAMTPDLVQALKSFQARHGRKPDGALGAHTFAALTRPLTARVLQIELTMERWRWLPAKLTSAPIVVNIPQFRLFAFESTEDAESRMVQMDVIVGKAFAATQTPVFTADMTYLVFRPYWDVPYHIALKEIVPQARADLASLEKHQMEIVRGPDDSAVVMPNTAANVEWVAKGVLRVRQRPGPNNSLGLVKFMLPNPYNVYLHSTPARSLFAKSRRDFSHGCIRVSDPLRLAEYVLRDSPGWDRDKILAAMDGPEPMTVPLPNRIRVFIVYGTALARERGDILFFDDIYGHDARLWQALQARRARRDARTRTQLASP